MSTGLILFLVVGLDLSMSCIRNRFAKGRIRTTADNIVYSLILTLTGILVPLVAGKWQIAVRKEVLVLAILFGLTIAFEQYVANESYRRGPMSLSSFMAQSGMLVTVAAACIFWGEKLTGRQCVGIVLMLGAMALMMFGPKTEDEKKGSIIWFLYAFAWLLACGTLGVLQKVFTENGSSEEYCGFLFFSFLASSVFLAVYLLLTLKNNKNTPQIENDQINTKQDAGITVQLKGPVGIAAAVSGLLYAGLHLSALIGVGNMNATYFFPVSNGLKLIMAVIAGAVLFHEKLIRTQYLGIGLGLVAILLLS